MRDCKGFHAVDWTPDYFRFIVLLERAFLYF